MKRTLSIFMATVLVVGLFMTNISNADSVGLMSRGYDLESLKSEIEYLDSLNVENIKEFYESNEAYLKDLEFRLQKYASDNSMSTENLISSIMSSGTNLMSAEERLLGTQVTPYSTKTMSDYFNSHTYHYRGEYWTYSMEPKMSTRLLRPVCANAWDVFKDEYPAVSNNENSLRDQYWCHFEAFFEAGWDIEEGCPDVGFIRVVFALCNPCQNAD